MPSSSLAVWSAWVDAATGEEILDLANRDDRQRCGLQAIEQRLARRRQRVVVAVRRAREAPRRADERARDHAADAQPFANELVGDLAVAIELANRHDVLVRRDLEDAVGRRVDDRRAGPHVLGSELVDDLRPGSGLVAEHAAPGPASRTPR